MRTVAGLVLVTLLSMIVKTAAAHHSLASLFDTARTVTVTGEVTQFDFIAPHGYIHMNVADESGEPTVWQLETYPPGMLMRKGLTPDVLRPGQKISARGYPSRDGRALMRLLTITMPDGEQRQIQ
ncbi:MAG: DUF6152 family protein [Gammaproteobacteria bacterium]|nr:DUF6152 family protein [Gammaproteobacteria bacterium]MCZ6584688.1 DUF6152 family protein [Gammaproteobacteria bacterium]